MSKSREPNLSEIVATLLVAACVVAVPAIAADDASGGDAQEDGEDGFVEYVEVNASGLPKSNTIATKLETPLLLTPANVGVVTRPLFAEQNAMVLGDALPNVSSLNVQAGPAVFDFFTVRGFDSLSSALVLTDGAAELESTFFQMYNVEGVEVLKGPGGFLYGRFPLAGTVNMVRKQPVPADFASLSVNGGSFDTIQGSLDWNLAAPSGDLAFRLNGTWSESDNYRDDKDSRVVAVNPSVLWRVDGRTTLNFGLEFVDNEFSPDSGLPLVNQNPFDPSSALVIPDVSRTISYQSPFDFSDQQVTRFQVDLEHRLSDRVKLRNKTYYRGLDWESIGTLFNGTAPDQTGTLQVLRTVTFLDDRQDLIGNQFEAVIDVRTGGVSHQLLTGVELSEDRDEFAIRVAPPQFGFDPQSMRPIPCDSSAPGVPCIAVFNPQEMLTMVPVPDARFTSTGDSRNRVAAPYVVDHLRFSESFRMQVGVRYDYIDFEDDSRGRSRSDGNLSPMIGLTGSPTRTFSVYANAGRSYAPPSPRLAAGSDFEPERSTQVELGIKKRLADDRLSATVAVYEMERDELAITLTDGFTQQAGDQRSRGVEAELAAEIAPRFRVFLNYAYNDSELTRFSRCMDPSANPCPASQIQDLSGNQAPYAPRNLARLWLSKSFGGGIGVAGGVRYVDSQFFDADNRFEVEDFVVLDATISYDHEAWRFRLNFQNLTDEEYETGSFASTSVVPADPFSVYGAIDYRF